MYDYQQFIGGNWVPGGDMLEVTNKYTGDVIGAVATARPEDVERAVQTAYDALTSMRELSAYERYQILMRVAAILEEREEELAKVIAMEGGKPIKYARGELRRAQTTFRFGAEEARRPHGEVLPLDAAPNGEGYFGFWHRRPIGVVAAITPFNFPTNLVAHKLAPAVAAGCPVVLKPAELTPLSSCLLVDIMHEAGVPAGGINMINGDGPSAGSPLVSHPKTAMVTFTGSAKVGEMITKQAGIKRVTLELGNASPVIIGPDADLDDVVEKSAMSAYSFAGQFCISLQRIYTDKTITEPFTEKFVKRAESMLIGDPLDERVDVGPLIRVREAERIESWVNEAQAEGANILTGGKREGNLYQPTVLNNVSPTSKVVSEEIFGPVASVMDYADFEAALHEANNTEYGLQAGLFTNDINLIFKAMDILDFGGIVVNQAPSFRADHMPYGGNGQSGLGREGLRFAIEEMTSIQMVSIKRR